MFSCCLYLVPILSYFLAVNLHSAVCLYQQDASVRIIGIFAQELTSGRNANVGSSKFQNIEAMQIDLRLFFLFFHSKLG